MEHTALIYLVFTAVVIVSLIADLGLISKKDKIITLRDSVYQSIFWVLVSLAFCGFLWYESGQEDAVQFLSAYLLEKSLSVDNIFVFIIIFNFFKVSEKNYSRVLFMGVMMAIIFRIVFIALGSELVARFSWIMYLFGAFLVYTGFKLLTHSEEEEFNPKQNWAYRFMTKYLRTTDEEPNGRYVIYHSGKAYLTSLAMVVVMLGLIDIVFAVDSIPAVFSIIPDPEKKLLIYSSNIFAVLGLRSLFFMLKGAAAKFDYLQQGIAIVLLFIGLKMLIVKWVHIPVWVSLMVIITFITGSILYSIQQRSKAGLRP